MNLCANIRDFYYVNGIYFSNIKRRTQIMTDYIFQSVPPASFLHVPSSFSRHTKHIFTVPKKYKVYGLDSIIRKKFAYNFQIQTVTHRTP